MGDGESEDGGVGGRLWSMVGWDKRGQRCVAYIYITYI